MDKEMNAMVLLRSLLLVGVLIGVVAWLLFDGGVRGRDEISKEQSCVVSGVVDREFVLDDSGRRGSSQERDEKSQRLRELSRLKGLWDALGPGQDRMDERRALAEESVMTLLCSAEMLELHAYLRAKKIKACVVGLPAMMSFPFTTDRAVAARASLLENPEIVNAFGSGYILESAGMGCSEEEFDAFRAEVLEVFGSDRGVLYGKNLARVKVDPRKAIDSMVHSDFLNPPNVSGREGVLWTRLIQNIEVDKEVDFEELVGILHSPDGLISEKVRVRATGEMFHRWAIDDLSGATEMVLRKPEFLEHFNRISHAAFFGKGLDQGVAWLKGLPDGELFDAAAAFGSSRFAAEHPERAKEIAAMIGDPEKARKQIEHVESVEKAVKEGWYTP